jgi:hypothetical protein
MRPVAKQGCADAVAFGESEGAARHQSESSIESARRGLAGRASAEKTGATLDGPTRPREEDPNRVFRDLNAAIFSERAESG